MDVDRLMLALAGFPRLSLVRCPTPLIEAPRLTAALGGPRILIKREDLCGLGLGGSKYRILEYTVGEAVAQGANVLVCGGMAQSNHPQQVATVGARLGLPVVVFLSDTGTGIPGWQGNALLEHIAGADVRIVRGADLDGVRRAQEEAAAELRSRGLRPALITLTRRVYVLSVLAYAGYALELIHQLREMRTVADAIYVASGGATYAGMLLGAIALSRPFQVVGHTPTQSAQTRSQYVAGLLSEAQALLGVDFPISESDIQILDDHLGDGHGIPSQGAIDAVRLVGSTEGFFLDPVYTGKAMAQLVDHARSGKLDGKTVVFAHTGGIPALFALADHFGPFAPSMEANDVSHLRLGGRNA